jgi:predicted nucleic acid-binding Zn ribbon protein
LSLATFRKQKNLPGGRKQTEQREIKRKVKYELQQIEIIGGKRGSDKDSVTNPHSRQKPHQRKKKPYPNIRGLAVSKKC